MAGTGPQTTGFSLTRAVQQRSDGDGRSAEYQDPAWEALRVVMRDRGKLGVEVGVERRNSRLTCSYVAGPSDSTCDGYESLVRDTLDPVLALALSRMVCNVKYSGRNPGCVLSLGGGGSRSSSKSLFPTVCFLLSSPTVSSLCSYCSLAAGSDPVPSSHTLFRSTVRLPQHLGLSLLQPTPRTRSPLPPLARSLSARASSPDPTPSLTPATSHTSHAQQDKRTTSSRRRKGRPTACILTLSTRASMLLSPPPSPELPSRTFRQSDGQQGPSPASDEGLGHGRRRKSGGLGQDDLRVTLGRHSKLDRSVLPSLSSFPSFTPPYIASTLAQRGILIRRP